MLHVWEKTDLGSASPLSNRHQQTTVQALPGPSPEMPTKAAYGRRCLTQNRT